jgi:hypothetical protein
LRGKKEKEASLILASDPALSSYHFDLETGRRIATDASSCHTSTKLGHQQQQQIQTQIQLGEIDDAVECLEAILVTIHCEAVGVPLRSNGDDRVCTPPCPACAVFKV